VVATIVRQRLSAALVTLLKQGGHPADGALPGEITEKRIDHAVQEASPLEPPHVLIAAVRTKKLVSRILRFRYRSACHVRNLGRKIGCS